MQKSQTVEVKLLGQKISLKSHGDPDLIKEVTEIVSRKIKEAEKRGKGSVAAHNVALLALFDLAEDYIQAKHRSIEHQRSLEEKSRELDRWLEVENA